MELICQGAEGKVFKIEYLGRPAVVKERLSKRYRVAQLDRKINKQRILQEARCIVKCRRAGVASPCIYLVDMEANKLYLEYISGSTFKDLIWSKSKELDPSIAFQEKYKLIAKAVGCAIGKMHDADVVHGDLTTSNIMIRFEGTTSHFLSYEHSIDESNPLDIVLIDFGLGMMKPTAEDKAVDLYVLERAFISTHPGSDYLVQAILESYRFNSRKGSTAVLQKLEQVRIRGRKRDMLG